MRTKISLKFKTLAHKGQAKELEQEVHEGQMEDKCQGWTATPRGKTISKTQDCREFKFFPKEFTLGVLNATFVLVVVSTSLGLCLPLSHFVSYLWWLCRLPWAFVSSCCVRLFLHVRFCHFGAPFFKILM